VQGGIAEAWKDNLLDKLAKRESEVDTVEKLFTKIKNNFGETLEEDRKIEQLQTIEQGGKTCDEYMQEFKKVARGSSYVRRPLIEEFKRGLNEVIRRKLAEVEELLTTIEEWQERVVRLDRNQRQSKAKQKRKCWREMWYAQREMYSQEEDIGEDRIEEERDKSCEGLETTVEDTRG